MKKYISCFLIAMLLASSFAGCSSDNSETSGSSDTGSTSTATSENSGDSASRGLDW